MIQRGRAFFVKYLMKVEMLLSQDCTLDNSMEILDTWRYGDVWLIRNNILPPKKVVSSWIVSYLERHLSTNAAIFLVRERMVKEQRVSRFQSRLISLRTCTCRNTKCEKIWNIDQINFLFETISLKSAIVRIYRIIISKFVSLFISNDIPLKSIFLFVWKEIYIKFNEIRRIYDKFTYRIPKGAGNGKIAISTYSTEIYFPRSIARSVSHVGSFVTINFVM